MRKRCGRVRVQEKRQSWIHKITPSPLASFVNPFSSPLLWAPSTLEWGSVLVVQFNSQQRENPKHTNMHI